MRFRIDAPEASHGIRVIDEIPDLPLCRIEGVNGVGKTLALHLLELCSGTQPYATRSHAWASLCHYLGPTEIIVQGLDTGGEAADGTLRFAFDWRGRTDSEAPREITTALFDEVSLDGEPLGRMGEVRELLSVVRIAGDQSLTDTIAGVVSYDAQLLRSAAALAGARKLVSDRHAEELLAAFPKAPAVAALELAGKREALATRRRELVARRDAAAARLDVLEAAERAAAAAAEIERDAGALKEEIIALREQAAAARGRSEEAERALVQARERERLSEEAATAQKKAESLVRRRLNDLDRLEGQAAELAEELGVAPEEAAVEKALEELRARREEVARRRGDAADAIALRDLLDGLLTALAPTVSGGLRERVIARIEGEPITAGALLDAVQERRVDVSEEMEIVETLDRELADLGETEERLEKLAAALDKAEAKRESLGAAEEALRELSDEAAEGGSSAECAAERAAAQRAEIEIGSVLGSAQRQLARLGGGASPEDLAAELARRLAEAGTTRAELAEALAETRGEAVETRDLLLAAGIDAETLEAEAAELGRELSRQSAALEREDPHEALRAILGPRAPRAGGDLVEQAEAWLGAHEAADRAVTRVQETSFRIAGLQHDIEDLLEAIRRGESPRAELDPVRRLYQERLLERFDQPELVAALFDNGRLTQIDLDAAEIVWRTAAGEPRVRPFEAFSSGERAFAYVQAQLAALSASPARNKVVAIDEFGAFLSTDRLLRLQGAVSRRLAEGTVDQAIVVLPLLGALDPGEASELGYVAGDFDVVAGG
jgi:hypothetical protein